MFRKTSHAVLLAGVSILVAGMISFVAHAEAHAPVAWKDCTIVVGALYTESNLIWLQDKNTGFVYVFNANFVPSPDSAQALNRHFLLLERAKTAGSPIAIRSKGDFASGAPLPSHLICGNKDAPVRFDGIWLP